MEKTTFRTPRRSERRAWRRKRLGLPSYSTAEEIWNAISHGLGAAFAIVALVILLVQGQHNALTVVSVSIYGSTMVLLYTVSTLYHALGVGRAKKVFQFRCCVSAVQPDGPCLVLSGRFPSWESYSTPSI